MTTTGVVKDDSQTSISPLVALYMTRRADLIRFFTLRTASLEEAQDIVQDIYLKIVDLPSDGVQNHAAFLYRLGTNVMIDRIRQKRRSAAREEAYFDIVVDVNNQIGRAEASAQEVAIDARRRLARLLAAIEALPPRRRQVFVMHKLDGLSYAEIAARLNVSRSAVEKHMMAALKRLAEFRR